VKLEIKQARSIPEILRAGLHTAGDGGPLQTAGMFEVSATRFGRSLQLGDGRNLVMMIPADSVYNDMGVFSVNPQTGLWQDARNGFRLRPMDLTIDFSLLFAGNLPSGQSRLRADYVRLLQTERRDVLNALIGSLLRMEMEKEVMHLIRACKIKEIRIEAPTWDSNASNGPLTIYKRDTKRILRLFDKPLIRIDYSKTRAVATDGSRSTLVPDSFDICGTRLRYYAMELPALGLVNIDRYLGWPAAERLMVNSEKLGESKVFLIFPVLGTVLPASPESTGTARFDAVMPGQEAILFAYCVRDGQWYFSKKAIVTGRRKTETLTWQPTDEEAILKEMQNI
jgi:hypothetical protein